MFYGLGLIAFYSGELPPTRKHLLWPELRP